MKVHFFERRPINSQISIEKLFLNIKPQLRDLGIETETFINPYDFKGMLKSLYFFYKNQGQINHITGDIHWIAIVLNPKKTILTIHDLVGMQNLTGMRRKIYFLLWIYWPVKRLKYITAISEKTKKEIVDLIPSASGKIMVINNCLTIPLIEDFKKKRNNKTKFLIIGTRSNKNIENSIKALKNIEGELNIVGDVTQEQIALLNSNNLEYNINFNVEENELIELYKESDILLFPSFYEGFGLPIIEAQAYQCAVITSNISPMKEVAGSGAVLVDPFSVNDIKNAILKIKKNEKFKEELINNGLSNVVNFSPKQIALQYFNLYQKIIKENDSN